MFLQEAGRRIVASAALGLAAVLVPVDLRMAFSQEAAPRQAQNDNKPAPAVIRLKSLVPHNHEAPALVSFEHILKTGQVPRYEFFPGSNQSINWGVRDEFVKSFIAVMADVRKTMDEAPAVKDLLAKPSWTKDDRVAWERALSQAVSQATDRITGLDNYRHVNNLPEFKGPFADRRASVLNDLSSDIRDGTAKIEFDCEAMSVFEGCVLQRMEEHFLPATSAVAGDFKKVSPYYYVGGDTHWLKNKQVSSHAFIISSGTGNLIEATTDPSEAPHASPYYEVVTPGYSFEEFIKGKAFLTRGDAVYGANFALGDALKLRFDWALQAAQAQTTRASEALKAVAAEPETAEILALMKDIAKKGFTDELRGRLTECLAKPGMGEKWDTLAQEQFALMASWNDLCRKTDNDAAYLKKAQDRYAEAMASSPWASCLPEKVADLAAVSFDTRMNIAALRTERLWQAARDFAGDCTGYEIMEIMRKEKLTDEDRAAVSALLAQPEAAALWSALVRDNSAMIKAWQDAHRASGDGTDTLRRVHDELSRLMKDMPEETRFLPRNKELETIGGHAGEWTEKYLKGLEEFLDKDKGNKVTFRLMAPALTMPALAV